MQAEQRYSDKGKREHLQERKPRIYAPHREFPSAKEFADWIRESELVGIYRAGVER